MQGDTPRSLKDHLYLFFGGMCMGAADLVPGISGGTMAFILGFYEPFIHAIKNLNWRFLCTLIPGVILSMALFAKALHGILNHDIHRQYLYALFTVLIIVSAFLCARQVPEWRLSHWGCLVFGAAAAFFLTISGQAGHTFALPNPMPIFHWWIFICGMIAVSAMLLPGISGSYILVILGMYPTVIGAIADFVTALQSGSFAFDPFIILINIATGILVGALFFSRLISWFLSRCHGITVATLTGFMLGALRALWN